MRAVDTNIIVRFLTGDEPAQAAKARAIIGHEPVFVPRTVLLEVEWVLRGVYDFPVGRIMPALRALLGLPGVSVEDGSMIARAIGWAESGQDFADACHVAAAAGCADFVTFDRKLVRVASRLGGVLVAMP